MNAARRGNVDPRYHVRQDSLLSLLERYSVSQHRHTMKEASRTSVIRFGESIKVVEAKDRRRCEQGNNGKAEKTFGWVGVIKH
jgi:hypothetical protein